MRNIGSIAGLFISLTLSFLCGAAPVQAGGNLTTSGASAAAGQNPDFDAVSWKLLQCAIPGDPVGDVNPSSTDFVGDATYPATYYAHDSAYLYFRYRVDTNPSGPNGFNQYAWVALMQIPSGNVFQHQFELSLNGVGAPDDFGHTGPAKGDNIEIWKNDPAKNIDYNPHYNDPSEIRLFAQKYDFASGSTVNTTPLARILVTGDGSSFGGTTDYFIDFAFPIQVMIDKGVISGVSDLDQSLFFPATSSDANQYNKDYLDCPFIPYTTLAIAKTAAPAALPADTTTTLTYTIVVSNQGAGVAKGVVIDDTALPSYMTNVSVTVSSSDATVTWSVVTSNPLNVQVPKLPIGSSVTVVIRTDAKPSCSNPSFTDTATAYASNASNVSADAVVTIGQGGTEICDGKDNDCDGLVDENGTVLCSDGNACNGVEACAGAAGCQPGAPPNCNDGNVCTDDSCNPASGCVHTNNTASCDDGNFCTRTDTCQSGSCVGSNPVVCSGLDQCHDSGVCNPATGACSNPSKPNGSSCDDGNACTRTDTCQAGSCTGSDPVVCAALDQCHDPGVCSPATGSCSNPDKPNGSSCSDGDLCTQTDTCQSGSCTGSNPVVCTALDQCHVPGTCNPASGTCSNPNEADGSSCNDGNACTQTDTCQGGSCVGSNPVVCTALDQCHDAGSCNPATGSCSNPNKPNGSSCDDGTLCTQTDTCQAGSCTGSKPIVCAALDQCHDAGACNPATGTCSNPDKPNGSSCDDGNLCTQTDTCQSGSCTGSNPVVCTALDQCHVPGTCNPATGTCSNPNEADGSSCNDGNPCTQTDTCQGGNCVGSNPVVCTALDQCHDPGSCNPATGSCSNPNKPNGSSCDDGNLCTQTDTCQGGSCVGSNPVACTALDQCHDLGTCNPATGTCSNPDKPNGSSCNDGNLCTQTDTCQSGNCVGSNPVACTALDQCHVPGTCNPATGACSNPNEADGSSCNDGNPCTQTDTCQGGSCVGSNPVVCAPLDQCHDAGSCNPATGNCSNPNKPNGSSCNDGNACTQTDTCQGGSCVGSNPVVCTALDQCHDLGTCNPATGTCSNPNRPNESSCDDGNLCTQTDTCQNGSCAGSNPVACTALDQCHVPGTCYPATGTCSNPNEADGSSCNDGNPCTQADTCQGGSCVGSNPIVCTPLDQCHDAGSCNPASGTCSNPNKPSGSSCNDGNACTQTDTCQGGSCVGSNPIVCTALDQCHDTGVCAPATGTCSNPNKSNGSSCDDGNLCTQTDMCQNGSCAGSNPIACTALDQCHDAGSCNPASGTCSNPDKPNGSSCDDDNACTRTDTCQGGSCVGSNPVVCTPLDQCHDAGSCNPASGTCSNPDRPNGSSCDDGNACTRTDTCQGGTCLGSNPVPCTASDQCHDPGTCNPSTGACSNPAKANGASCSDGNACTQTDTCQAGNCVGSNPVACSASDQCHQAGACDPDSGLCSNPPKADGASCTDGDACTRTDTCQAGACVGSNPVTCAALDQCHDAGSCLPATGQCTNPIKPNGSSCDDGNTCTRTDTCQAGSCTGSNPLLCEPLDQCHATGTCDPGTGACSYPAKPDGTACDDGNACTRNDACQAGACVGKKTNTCPSDQCHEAGVCDPQTGLCSGTTRADGTACDDGNPCTTTDSCQSGVCVGSNPVTCAPPDQCHNPGTCDPASGSCTYPPKSNGSSCNDGNACTHIDTCQAGSCVGGNPVTCTALDQCHQAGTCDPASGLCSNPPKPDGAACSDGNGCTRDDTCQGGACVGGGPVTCTALDQCHVAGTCNPATGACSNPAKPDGTACNDANLCTGTDTCQGGTCVGNNTVTCTALDQCHAAGTCNPATGACSNPAKTDGTACSDGNACTTSDTCRGGACVGGPALSCDDGSPCTTDTCNSTTGCVHQPESGGTISCGTGACRRTVEACVNGAEAGCVPGQPSPEICNGIDDDCDGKVDENVCGGGGSPHTIGFYKRLCAQKSHPSGEALTQADVDCVNDSATFRWVTKVADICKVLNPVPATDKCKQAESQFMGLLLNVCKGHLSGDQPITPKCSTMATVGQTVSDCDSMLSSSTRTRSQCVKAQCESEEINSGRALPK